MSKVLNIEVHYDAATRQLVSKVLLTGFVPEVVTAPQIAAMQTDTLRLFQSANMTAVDQQHVVKSVANALHAANVELVSWSSAVENIDKTDQLLAADIDPVDAFNNAIARPTTENPV